MYCKFCSLISIRYFNLSLFLINGSKCSINSNGNKSYRFWSHTKCFSASNEKLLFYWVRKKSFSRQTSVASIENTRPNNNDDIVSRENFRRFRVHENFHINFLPSRRHGVVGRRVRRTVFFRASENGGRKSLGNRNSTFLIPGDIRACTFKRRTGFTAQNNVFLAELTALIQAERCIHN